MDPFKQFENILLTYTSEEAIKSLKKRWKEKHRFYHNEDHLKQIIIEIERNVWFSELTPYNKAVLLLAAFFHDAIYDPKRNDNEDQSIEFFKKCIKKNESGFAVDVMKLIEVTKHRKRPTALLSKIFWDADNAGFKKGYDYLLKNEKLIRKEYKDIPVLKYKNARIEFLKSCIGLFDKYVDEDLLKLIIFVEKNYK